MQTNNIIYSLALDTENYANANDDTNEWVVSFRSVCVHG